MQQPGEGAQIRRAETGAAAGVEDVPARIRHPAQLLDHPADQRRTAVADGLQVLVVIGREAVKLVDELPQVLRAVPGVSEVRDEPVEQGAVGGGSYTRPLLLGDLTRMLRIAEMPEAAHQRGNTRAQVIPLDHRQRRLPDRHQPFGLLTLKQQADQRQHRAQIVGLQPCGRLQRCDAILFLAEFH